MWRRTARRGAAVVAGALIATALTLGAHAQPRDSARPAVRVPAAVSITAPGDGAVVPRAALRARFRVRGPVSSLRVRVNHRDVTRAVRRVGAGSYSLLLASRHLHAQGPNHLTVHAQLARGRYGSDHVSFVVGRRSRGHLSVAYPAHASVHDPGTVGVGLRLAAPSENLAVSLNGRPVRHVLRFQSAPASSHAQLDLAAHDGLRHGRNTVTVRAHRADGTHDVESRTFHVRSHAPLPSAGHDRVTAPGRAVRLDATRTRPARRGAPLRLRWRIAAAPPGSRARIRGVSSARPLITPDRPGRYRLELRAAHPGPLAAADTAPRDVVEVAVRSRIPPVGLRVETLVQQDGQLGTRLGDTFLKSPNPSTVQLVVLDRDTLDVKGNFDPTDGEGWARARPTEGDVVVTSGARGCCGNGWMNWTTTPPPGTSTVLSPGFTHVYSVSSQTLGTLPEKRTSNVGLEIGGVFGGLTGYLQEDAARGASRRRFKFERGEYVSFDLDPVPGTFGGFTLADKHQSWEAYATMEDPDGHLSVAGAAGFDASRRPIPADGSGGFTIAALTRYLEKVARTPGATVFVRTRNIDTSRDPAWGPAADALERLGGTRAAFLGMRDGEEYALVGGVGISTTEAQEARGARADMEGALRGLLQRRSDSHYVPQVHPRTEPVNQLLPVAYQPATRWPSSDTPSKREAMSYIASRLGISKGANRGACYATDTADVRAAYCNGSNWSNDKSKLPTAAECDQASVFSDPGGWAFHPSDCKSLSQSLGEEFGWVDTVSGFVGKLQSLIESAAHSGVDELLRIAGMLEREAPVREAPGSIYWLQLAADLGSVAAAASGHYWVGLGAAGLAFLLNQLDSYYGGQLDEEERATPFDVTNQAWDIAARAKVTLGELRDILVSDYGKLMTAAANVKSGPWALGTFEEAEMATALSQAWKRWLWRAMLPMAYDLYAVRTSLSIPDLPCQSYYKPFKDLPDSSAFTWDDTFGKQPPLTLLLGRPAFDNSFRGFRVAPRNLTEPLFRPASEGGLGLSKPLFFSSGFVTKRVYDARQSGGSPWWCVLEPRELRRR